MKVKYSSPKITVSRVGMLLMLNMMFMIGFACGVMK